MAKYKVLDCVTYQRKVLQPGTESDFANLNEKQIQKLLDLKLIEKVKEQSQPKTKGVK